MKIPARIRPLVEDGLVDEVLARLMSGKEADIYIVRCGAETRCAKVYKEAAKRSFKHAVRYREGRSVRSSRRARAMEKGTRFGRQEREVIWQSAEVDALRKLDRAGVRVPVPYLVVDGVLLMELVTDAEGAVAPRLGEVHLDAEHARAHFATVLDDVVRMLCVGVIHGDLSAFNVLLGADGPVIIDLPQAVDAAANQGARAMFLRDVANMKNHFAGFAPELGATRYGEEIWDLFERGALSPEVELTGTFAMDEGTADVDGLLDEIEAVIAEERARLARIANARMP